MATPHNSQKNEQPSTYVVQDRQNKEVLQPDFKVAGDIVTAWGTKPDWQ